MVGRRGNIVPTTVIIYHIVGRLYTWVKNNDQEEADADCDQVDEEDQQGGPAI